MIVIVDHVTLKDEEGNMETVVKIADSIEHDIKELLRCGIRIVVLQRLMTYTAFLRPSMRS